MRVLEERSTFVKNLAFAIFLLSLDTKYEAIVLPIFGVATPFHISTVKVSRQQDELEYVFADCTKLCNSTEEVVVVVFFLELYCLFF